MPATCRWRLPAAASSGNSGTTRRIAWRRLPRLSHGIRSACSPRALPLRSCRDAGTTSNRLPPALAGKALIGRAEEAVERSAETLGSRPERAHGPPKLVHQTLFSTLDAEGLRAMVGIFDVMTVPAGAHVIEEGMVGVGGVRRRARRARGAAWRRRVVKAVRLARLGSGALFGEMALLSRAPRAASVVACRPSILLVASKDALEAVVEQQPQVGREFAAHCRQPHGRKPGAYQLRPERRRNRRTAPRWSTASRRARSRRGDSSIEQDQESDGLHLIASGEVAVVHREGEDTHGDRHARVRATSWARLRWCLRRPATADVIAEHPTVTLHLPRDGFLDIVKRHPALLAQLYELAVKRDEETSSIVAQEATDIDEFVLI